MYLSSFFPWVIIFFYAKSEPLIIKHVLLVACNTVSLLNFLEDELGSSLCLLLLLGIPIPPEV